VRERLRAVVPAHVFHDLGPERAVLEPRGIGVVLSLGSLGVGLLGLCDTPGLSPSCLPLPELCSRPPGPPRQARRRLRPSPCRAIRAAGGFDGV